MPNYEHARYPYDHEQFDDNQHEQTRNRRKRNRGRFSNSKRSFLQVRRPSVCPASALLPSAPALLTKRSLLLWQVKKSNEQTNSRRTAAGRAASYQRSKAAKQQLRQAAEQETAEDLGVPIPRPDGSLLPPPRPPQPPPKPPPKPSPSPHSHRQRRRRRRRRRQRQQQPQILRIVGDATGAAAGCVYPLLHDVSTVCTVPGTPALAWFGAEIDPARYYDFDGFAARVSMPRPRLPHREFQFPVWKSRHKVGARFFHGIHCGSDVDMNEEELYDQVSGVHVYLTGCELGGWGPSLSCWVLSPARTLPKNLAWNFWCDGYGSNLTDGCVVWSTTNCRAHVEVERQYERGNPAVATEQGDDSFHSQVDRRIREQSHPYVREPRAVKLACCVVVVVIVVIVGNWYCCWLAGGWLPYTGNLLAL